MGKATPKGDAAADGKLAELAFATCETLERIKEIVREGDRGLSPPGGPELPPLIRDCIEQCRQVAKIGYRADNKSDRAALVELEDGLKRLPDILEEYDKSDAELEAAKALEAEQLALIEKSQDAPNAQSSDLNEVVKSAKRCMDQYMRRKNAHEPVELAQMRFDKAEGALDAVCDLIDSASKIMRLMAQQPEPFNAYAKRRKQYSRNSLNEAVIEYLKQRPNATSREIGRALGVSHQAVQKTRAFKVITAKRKEQNPPKPKAQRLNSSHYKKHDDDQLGELIAEQEKDGNSYKVNPSV
jgi:hypothetical protein